MSDSHMRRAFTALSEITPAVAGVTSIDDLLRLVTKRAAALVGVERCSIYMREDRANLFRGCVGCSKGRPLPEDFKRWVAGVAADGVTREVLETRRPVVVVNARQDVRMVKSTVRHWQIRSLLEVPMVVDGQVSGLLLMDDVDRQHEFSADEVELGRCFADLAGSMIVQTQTQLELQSKLGAASRQLNALRRATAVDERLSDLVLEGRSLADLTATLAELLGKPCALFLPGGERVATALPEAAPQSALPRLLEPAVAELPEVRRVLAENEGSRVFVVSPVPAAGVLHRHVVASILLGDELWGRLVVMEHKTRFTGGDVVAVRRAATLIALQVSSERTAAEADWNAGASLAAELLGCGSDAAVARRRADRLGVRLDAERLVVVFASRSGAAADAPDFRAVAAAFEREAPDLTVHVTALEGGVAALAEVPAGVDPRGFALAERERFEAVRASLAGSACLIAGVSAVRNGPEGYRVAYREARQVVECIRRFSPSGGPALFTADELGVGSLLLSSSDGEAMATFAEQTVGELLREHSKADLLTTLCSFFDNMGLIRGAAAALDVHENTIRYRLSRIEELTGLAVMHDPDAQLRARLSLLVLLLQGRLPSGVAAAAPAVPAVAAVVDLEVVPA
ncbi:MAG TPA: GAF domain-containing protein [Solirubrobacterales bacterium]|jgi:sugar diacid utilization regulator|nr:GAF domain-containing protein [Solirubrobacterales bacterium]